MEIISDFIEVVINMGYWFLIFNNKNPSRATRVLGFFMDTLQKIFAEFELPDSFNYNNSSVNFTTD
jgi:hypothetical protein